MHGMQIAELRNKEKERKRRIGRRCVNVFSSEMKVYRVGVHNNSDNNIFYLLFPLNRLYLLDFSFSPFIYFSYAEHFACYFGT